MAKKSLPAVLVVTNTNRPGTQTRRRTVRPKMGAEYQIELPPGQPVVLVGEDEIAAVEKDLRSDSVATLRLTPEQAQHVLADLADKASADEITRLRRQVEKLTAALEAGELKAEGVANDGGQLAASA